MDVEKLKAIVAALSGTEVSRLEWQDGEERIELRFGHPPAAQHAVHTVQTHAAPAQAPAAHAAPAPAAPAAAVAAKAEAKGLTVNSPFVGTFYRSASPESPAFCDIGTVVKKGQVLCIVEAMKLMNEIEAEAPGKIVEILVNNGSPVEYGEPLFRYERSNLFQRILIANRGEIALRIIRAAREMGIQTVAVHSTADANSLHVKFADQSFCIGPPASKDSYLNLPALISAAEVSGADAIHPGYGFLSENSEFAEMVKHCGLGWIGPRPEMIRMMGNKVRAKAAMKEAGLPQLPGSPGVISDEKELPDVVEKIGFPVILKAAAGGGGRGMKIIREKDRDTLVSQFRTASAEALSAFGNGDMYVERYVEQPRHIEIQIVADEHGEIIHLGERECSVQRRHQKMLEESPSPAVNDKLREKMGRVAVEAMKKVGYNNVGTIEFLLDERSDFYFMEMNTRIQVEHPVTEAVTGIDLLKEQIRLAAGEPLGRTQKSIQMRGHSIECRVNAEDPVTFAPSPGLITAYNAPGGLGVRVDSVAYEQYKVLPYYDSMVAKLIVEADSRPAAIMRMRRALQEYIVEGIKTNIPFHRRLLTYEPFVQGKYDTRLVERLLAEPRV